MIAQGENWHIENKQGNIILGKFSMSIQHYLVSTPLYFVSNYKSATCLWVISPLPAPAPPPPHTPWNHYLQLLHHDYCCLPPTSSSTPFLPSQPLHSSRPPTQLLHTMTIVRGDLGGFLQGIVRERHLWVWRENMGQKNKKRDGFEIKKRRALFGGGKKCAD